MGVVVLDAAPAPAQDAGINCVLQLKHKLIIKITILFIPVILSSSGLYLYQYFFSGLPDPSKITNYLPQQSIRIVDRYGRLLYDVLPEYGGRHIIVSLNSIPDCLKNATIATEDTNFYSNPGVDIRGVIRALWINLQGGETLAGGSTITQQLVRNLLFSVDERNELTIRRKIRESYLAWILTREFTKDEILSFYLNHIYYGGFAYGVEAAANTYFGKSVSELDLAESAFLAGLPQAPAFYNPYTNLSAALKRQQVVLDLMEKAGYITREEHKLAEAEPLIFTEKPYPVEAPHFVMMVRNEIDNLVESGSLSTAQIMQGGLTVTTTIDLDWQKIGVGKIKQQIERLNSNSNGLAHNVNNAALIAIDPNTGEILSLVGSPDYFDVLRSGSINMVTAPRQPGSALKPLIYAAAIDPSQPNPWTAAQMILDVRTSFITSDGKAYTPQNYDGKEHGPVSVREALASSLNIPAVITLNHIGMDRFISFGTLMGISTLEDPRKYDLSIALGGGNVSLLELTSAYAVFANGGYRITPSIIKEIRDHNGKIVYQPSPFQKHRIIDERVAWLISDILSDKEARFIGFGKNTILQLDRPAAVKTGTTTNFHDNWTIGYTPDLVVGVWVGNANYEPMRNVTGLTGAAPIWHEFMRSVLYEKGKMQFIRPPSLSSIEICIPSGMLPTPYCPYKAMEWFIDGTQPTDPDRLYQEVTIDKVTGKLAGPNTPTNQELKTTALNLPIEANNWVKSNGYLSLLDLLSSANLTSPIIDGSDSKLIITDPPPNTTYRLSSTLPPELQSIKIEVITNLTSPTISLWLDGKLLTTFLHPPFVFWWILKPGIHQIWAQATQNGNSITSEIDIIKVEQAIP